jgi:hypothetical protein
MVVCQVRLADNEGRLWQTDTAFSPCVLLQHLLDLRRNEPPRLVCNLPQEMRSILDGPCLAANAYDGYDHRAYRYFYLDGSAWLVRFKHQGAYHDVFLLEGTTLLVRSRALYGEGWNPLPMEDEAGLPLPAGPPYTMPDEEDEEAFAQWEESEEASDGNMPDIVHTMDLRSLLLRSRLPLPGGAYWDSDLPVPVIFRRVMGQGPPERAVSIQPKPPPLPSPTQAEAGQFVTWTLENNHELDLRTRCSGVLHVGADYLIKAQAAFEIALGSESEPVDVIRCRVRLTDEEGGLWEAVTHFTPEAFLEGMTALLPADHPRFVEGEEQREDEPLLAGIRGGILDDGGWRHFLVGSWAVSVCFNNQRPRYALFGGGYRVRVQASGLVGYRRAINLDNEQGFMTWVPDAQSAGLREEELPPIVFDMADADLLFRNTTFAVDDGFWHQNDLPIPIVFERLDTRAEPQEGVQFRPDVER